MGGGANNSNPKSSITLNRGKKRCKTLGCKKLAKHFGYCKRCWKEK